MVRAGGILTGSRLAGHGRQAGIVEHLAGAFGDHLPQALAQHLQGLGLEPQPDPGHRTLHQVGSH